MSRDLVVSMLDLGRFAAVLGSRDRPLLDHILSSRREQIVAHDDYLKLWEDPATYTSLTGAIERIFDGRVEHTFEPLFQFEHAAGLIADVLGEPLESDLLSGASEDFWEEVDAVLEGYRQVHSIPPAVLWTLRELIARGPYLEVPIDAGMRVGSGYLTADEVGRTAAALRDQDFTADVAQRLEWPDEAVEGAEQYRDWIFQAARRGFALFMHC
jgi:hypothetical protein